MSAISFHHEHGGLHVDYATPVYWFGEHELNGPLFRSDGQHVTVRAANGTWVWQLTGNERTETHHGKLVRCLEGIWPD